MGTINQFIIDGNVTKDVFLSYTPSGTPKASYTVAVDNVFYEDGQKREQTDYIPVTSYGRQAENDAKYLKKGAGVTVMGSVRSWYNPETRRGGFNFEAQNVKYQAKPHRIPQSVESAPPEDAWLREYDAADGGGQSPATVRVGPV